MGLINSEPEEAGTESSRSDRELAQLHSRCGDLSGFVENATVPLHGIAPDGTIVWANRAQLDLLGYPEPRYVGRNIAEFHARPEAAQDILRRLESGEPVHGYQTAFRCAGGSLKDVILDISVRREDGRFVQACCFIRDNTGTKQAEKALAGSEQRYRALFETALDAIMIVDDSGHYVDANESLCRILGVPRERLIGMHFSRFMPGSALNQASRLFADLKTTGQFRGRFPMLTAAGGAVQLEWTSRANFIPGLHFCVAREVTEQVRTEERLKRSHERYKAFVAQSSEGIWRMELESPVDVSLPEDEQIRQFYSFAVLAEYNAEFASMYGFDTAEEITGRRLEDFLPADRHNLDYLRAFIRSGYRLSNAESHERDRRGYPRYMLNHLVGVVEEGKLLRAWGTQRDITAQKRTARRLWDAQSRLALRNGILASMTSGASADEVVRQTAEQVHLCFPELRCGYSTVDHNGARTVFYTIDPEGIGAFNAVPVDTRVPAPYLDALRRRETIIVEDVERDPRFHRERAALLRAGTRAVLEVPLQHGGEHTGVLFFHAFEPRQWSDHEITTLREVARDLTAAIQKAADQEARSLAQAALEASEKRLRLALAAGRMSCWECDLTSGAIAYTPAPDSPPGAFPASLDELPLYVHEEDRAHVQEAFRRVRQEGGTFHAEYRMAPLGGAYRWFETRAEAHRDQTGRWSRTIGVSSDISERRLSEETLRHRQKLEGLGVLAGGVAHDFNNLLTGILGNATLAAELVDRNHPAHVLVEDVCLAGERAAELTHQLLAYAGKGQYVLAPLDLSALVQDTCRLIQLSIPRKTSLRLDLANDLPRIEADRGQLQQIVMNLVLNAGEAVVDRENPEIRVTTRAAEIDEAWLRRIGRAGAIEPGPYVVLTVEDNGTGMDEATKARIFDPFFTTKTSGRGLGLAAVHGIVRAHRGGLVVTSAQGCGTVFQVSFPVARSAAEQEVPTVAAAERRRVVLVVDGEAHARQSAADILTDAGYHVVVAEDGPAALQALRETAAVAAVLMDAAFASGNFAHMMRELRPEVPVVLSGNPREGDADAATALVQKPFLPEALLSRIAAVTSPAIAAAASAGEAAAPDSRTPNSS